MAQDTELLTWHSGEDDVLERGLLVKYVTRPHLADIREDGKWSLYYLTPNDQQRYVAKGKAASVATARLQAEQRARRIPSVRKALKADEALEVAKRSDTTSAGANVFKAYTAITFAIIGFGYLIYAVALWRPWLLLRIVGVIGAALFIAHRLHVFADNAAKRHKRLTAKAALEALPSSKGKGKR